MNGPLMTAPALLDLLQGGTLTGEWILDPHASSVRLRSKVFGLLPVNGVFREVSGTGFVSGSGAVAGTLVVGAASVSTGNARRDTHLRSADFFDSDNHPDITFTADSVRPSAGGVEVSGALAVVGRARPLSFDAVVAVMGSGEVRLSAVVRVDRTGFGITWNLLGMVSSSSTLTVHAVFTRR